MSTDGKTRVTIGRSLDSTIVVDDEYASPQHAEIVTRGDVVTVADLGSTNGTYVRSPDGVKIKVPLGSRARIAPGWAVIVGRTEIPWSAPPPPVVAQAFVQPRSWVLPQIPAGVRLRDERDGHTWTRCEDPDLVGEHWTDGEAVISLGQLLQTRGRLTGIAEGGDTNG